MRELDSRPTTIRKIWPTTAATRFTAGPIFWMSGSASESLLSGQTLEQRGFDMRRELRRHLAERAAPRRRQMRDRIHSSLEDIMIEHCAPRRALPGRQLAQG